MKSSINASRMILGPCLKIPDSYLVTCAVLFRGRGYLEVRSALCLLFVCLFIYFPSCRVTNSRTRDLDFVYIGTLYQEGEGPTETRSMN